MKNKTKIRKIDLQRALAMRMVKELRSGWGISKQSMEYARELFPQGIRRRAYQPADK